jgi:aminoglycoside/choline kinase family phosphotransferase
MSDFTERLQRFLKKDGRQAEILQLTPDASTREYFRIFRNGESAIACVYPEPFAAAGHWYLDVTELFRSNGLPVAEIYEFDEELGVVMQEDLGDTILRDVLAGSDKNVRESLIDDAIRLIARIQLATKSAYERSSIASKLKFDTEKLLWELDFFRTHYFQTYRMQPLSPGENAALDVEFRELAVELESRAAVLCHRDFHAANLMIDRKGQMRIIDHQDARIGTASYDLVSLLLDRVTEPPPAEWLAEKRALLVNERDRVGLPSLDEEDLAFEFRMQTVQRCLKAVGTFSFQSVNRGKTYFVPYIAPMFEIVIRAIDRLGRYPHLRRILLRETA